MKKIALIILNLKLKYKLIALSTITCTISIILTFTVLIFNDIKNIREWTIDEVTILAKILGEQSIPSLIFHQAHVSKQSLTSLDSKSNILSACIFQDKNLFASYNRNEATEGCPSTSPELYKNYTDVDIIAVHLEIRNEGELLGSILVKSNTSEVSEAIKETLWNAIITAMVSICIAYFISYLLQRIISKPINQLVISANQTRAGDYSVRINHNSKDEIGQLAEDFNAMIKEVQMRDSALKEANEHLEAKVEERTRKLELSLTTRQRFIDNMNHEIRTPVHNMVSIVYRLINNWNHHKSEEEIIKDLGKVLFAGRRLNALLEDILELSKVKNGQYILFVNPTRISMLINNTLKEMDQALKNSHVTYVVNIVDDEPDILCDRIKITRVLRNIIDNAIKYGGEGEITIDVNKQELNGEKSLVVSVKDQGIGIPQNEEKAIFEQFVESTATQSQAKGIGLGLSICKEIVEYHHGNMFAKNNAEGGACITMVLPQSIEINNITIKEADEERLKIISKASDVETIVQNAIEALSSSSRLIPNDPENTSSTIIKTKHRPYIVVADDEEMNLEILEYILAPNQYNAVFFKDGGAVWNHLKSYDGIIDLVILDNMMPVLTGTEIITMMQDNKRLRNVPVMIQSGKILDDEVLRGLGDVHYIKKPFDSDDLEALIAEIVTVKDQDGIEEHSSVETILDNSVRTEKLSELEHIFQETAKDLATNAESAVKFVGHLPKLEVKINDMYEKIYNHILNGDLTDTKENSRLWHDLDNIKHNTNNITTLGTQSIERFCQDVDAITDPLGKLRPPKDDTSA